MRDVPEVIEAVRSWAEPAALAALSPAEVRAGLHRVNELESAVAAVRTALVGRLATSGGFRADGAVDAAGWLRTNGRVSGRAAKQLTDAAAATATLAGLAEMLRAGTVTVEHASVLAPVAEAVASGSVAAEAAAPLLAAAASEPPEVLRRKVASWALSWLSDGGNALAVRQRANTRVDFTDGDLGMSNVFGSFDPERGAVVRNAIDALVDDAWRRGAPATTEPVPRIGLAARRAEAMVEMARRSLAGTVSAGAGGPRRGAPEVLVHIDWVTLRTGELRPDGLCELDDGTPVPVETARRLACDAGIIPVVLAGPSEPLDIGRTQRLATAGQRRALRARRGTCEFAGCTVPAVWCQVHHLDEWEHGGSTDLERLAWVCAGHHHFVHEGGWRLDRHGGCTITLRPDGTVFDPRPP